MPMRGGTAVPAKRKVWPKVACELCLAIIGAPCLTESGKPRSKPHAVRVKAAKAARARARAAPDRSRLQTGLLPGHYQLGPTPVTIRTDLMHLGVYSPEEITPARERESKLNEGVVELTYLINVKLVDGQFDVTTMIGGARTELPDMVVRQIRDDMHLLEAIAREDAELHQAPPVEFKDAA